MNLDNPFRKSDPKDQSYERIELERIKSQERIQARDLEFKDRQAKREAVLKYRAERFKRLHELYNSGDAWGVLVFCTSLTVLGLGIITAIGIIKHFW